jgi:hypothetical protein
VTDPGETTDLAAKNPEVVKALKIKLENWQRSTHASLAGLDKTEKPVVTINEKKLSFKNMTPIRLFQLVFMLYVLIKYTL